MFVCQRTETAGFLSLPFELVNTDICFAGLDMPSCRVKAMTPVDSPSRAAPEESFGLDDTV